MKEIFLSVLLFQCHVISTFHIVLIRVGWSISKTIIIRPFFLWILQLRSEDCIIEVQ